MHINVSGHGSHVSRVPYAQGEAGDCDVCGGGSRGGSRTIVCGLRAQERYGGSAVTGERTHSRLKALTLHCADTHAAGTLTAVPPRHAAAPWHSIYYPEPAGLLLDQLDHEEEEAAALPASPSALASALAPFFFLSKP